MGNDVTKVAPHLAINKKKMSSKQYPYEVYVFLGKESTTSVKAVKLSLVSESTFSVRVSKY